MAAKAAKYKVGQRVSYPEDPEGEFRAGTGTVDSITPGRPNTYRVKSDVTGKVLDMDFPESELTD